MRLVCLVGHATVLYTCIHVGKSAIDLFFWPVAVLNKQQLNMVNSEQSSNSISLVLCQAAQNTEQIRIDFVHLQTISNKITIEKTAINTQPALAKMATCLAERSSSSCTLFDKFTQAMLFYVVDFLDFSFQMRRP